MSDETVYTPARARRRRDAGVTFLEVVLSAALFAGVAATTLGAYAAIQRWSAIQEERLNATEVAHRLVLIYTLDGPDKLPDERDPIEQGRGLYRFRLIESSLTEETGTEENISIRSATPMRTISSDRRIQAGLVMATIEVYPDPSTAMTDPDQTLASVSRVFDPFDPSAPDDTLLNHVMQMLGEGISVPQGLNP